MSLKEQPPYTSLILKKNISSTLESDLGWDLMFTYPSECLQCVAVHFKYLPFHFRLTSNFVELFK